MKNTVQFVLLIVPVNLMLEIKRVKTHFRIPFHLQFHFLALKPQLSQLQQYQLLQNELSFQQFQVLVLHYLVEK
jgi:hypothetical protein